MSCICFIFSAVTWFPRPKKKNTLQKLHLQSTIFTKSSRLNFLFSFYFTHLQYSSLNPIYIIHLPAIPSVSLSPPFFFFFQLLSYYFLVCAHKFIVVSFKSRTNLHTKHSHTLKSPRSLFNFFNL